MNILLPVFALILLTFLVYPTVLISRIAAVRRGELTMDYFKIFDGGTPPENVIKTTRNVAHLFEAPVLFYVACLMVVAIGFESTLMVYLAWAYVTLRYVHSAIHLTYNVVSHRLAVFLATQAVLVVMWVVLFLRVLE